jgi:hypothetical protein
MPARSRMVALVAAVVALLLPTRWPATSRTSWRRRGGAWTRSRRCCATPGPTPEPLGRAAAPDPPGGAGPAAGRPGGRRRVGRRLGPAPRPVGHLGGRTLDHPARVQRRPDRRQPDLDRLRAGSAAVGQPHPVPGPPLRHHRLRPPALGVPGLCPRPLRHGRPGQGLLAGQRLVLTVAGGTGPRIPPDQFGRSARVTVASRSRRSRMKVSRALEPGRRCRSSA